MKRKTKQTSPVFRVCVLPGGALPYRASEGAAGYDIPTRAIVHLDMDASDPRMRKTLYDFVRVPADPRIAQRVRNGKFMLLPGETAHLGTGVAIELPEGVAGFVLPRGKTVCKKKIAVLDSGVPIDFDYRAETIATIRNDTKKPFLIGRHQRIAQFFFTPAILPTLKEVKALSRTARGNNSHGSTGT